MLQSGGGNQKWRSCGQIGYVIPPARGPSALVGGLEVAHKWADWQHDLCRMRGTQRLRAPRKVGSDEEERQNGYIIPPRGWSATFQSSGQIQKWATKRQIGYVTIAVWGIPMLKSGGQN